MRNRPRCQQQQPGAGRVLRGGTGGPLLQEPLHSAPGWLVGARGLRDFVGLQRQHRRWELCSTGQSCDGGVRQPDLPRERSELPVQLWVRCCVRHGQQQCLHALDGGLSGQVWPRRRGRGAPCTICHRDRRMVEGTARHTHAATLNFGTQPRVENKTFSHV